MELYQLRTFVVVAAERNVTKAAKRLFMTPPAVSAHIKALEDELNVTLFVRTPQGMQITEKGELLRQKAEQTLRAAQDMVNYATHMQSYLMGHLTIGLNTRPNFLRVGAITTQMAANCPGIELSFVTSVTGKILIQLQNSTLDMGFIFGPAPSASIATSHLATCELVVGIPQAWQAQLETVDWPTLASLPWVYSDIYCPFQTILDNLFRQKNLSSRRVVETNDDITKYELISSGIGAALLERHEAQEVAQTHGIAICEVEPIRCELSLACLKDRASDPLIMAFEKEFRSVWAASNSQIL